MRVFGIKALQRVVCVNSGRKMAKFKLKSGIIEFHTLLPTAALFIVTQRNNSQMYTNEKAYLKIYNFTQASKGIFIWALS